MKKLTFEKFNQVLDTYIENEKKCIKEHEQIAAILKPLEGKPINGRTLNDKKLSAFANDNGFPFKYVFRYGMHHIKGNQEHLIGYDRSENLVAVGETYFSRGFEYFDACHGRAAKQRIEQLEKLDREKAFKIFSEIEYHFNSLRELFGIVETEKLGSYHFPAYYDVLREIFNQDDKIKLTDFYFIRTNKN